MAGTDHDEALVGQRVENAIRDRHSFRIAAKVMVMDPIGFLFPRRPIVFEVSDHLFLFTIDAEDRTLAGGEFLALPVDVLKLPIAGTPRRRGLVAGFQRLLIDAPRETHIFLPAADRGCADVAIQGAALSGNGSGWL